MKLASPKELEGKKLAFTQGNSQVLLLAKMATMYGFDASKVTLVNMQPSEGVVAASKGDVHGLLGWQPNLYRLVQLGGTMYADGTTLFVTGKEQRLAYADWLQYNHSILLASQDWIDTKPNTLQAVLRAFKRATDLLASDRKKALSAMQARLRIDADALEVMATANKYALGINDHLKTSLTFQSDWAMQIKRISAAVTPQDAFAPGPLAAVDPSLVTWKA
ncbi:MAG: ABC transporter substrate-binding protein [Acetobacteraceae bacterium]